MTDLAFPWRPEQPHNQLPALPPARELESRAVLKACIEARAALAELKQAAELIPNQAMLIKTIPLLEAKDSSEIENVVTTTDQLFRYPRSVEYAVCGWPVSSRSTSACRAAKAAPRRLAEHFRAERIGF